MSQLSYQGLRLEQGRNGPRLIVPHKGGELTFLYPPYGPHFYTNVGSSIVQSGLNKPTMAETAFLVHAAFNSPHDDRYKRKIEDIMKMGWLWAFIGTLYFPKEGAFI